MYIRLFSNYLSASFRYNKTIPQVLIRWSVQKNYITIPKSSKQERILENGDIFDFTISEEDMKTLVRIDWNGFKILHFCKKAKTVDRKLSQVLHPSSTPIQRKLIVLNNKSKWLTCFFSTVRAKKSNIRVRLACVLAYEILVALLTYTRAVLYFGHACPTMFLNECSYLYIYIIQKGSVLSSGEIPQFSCC